MRVIIIGGGASGMMAAITAALAEDLGVGFQNVRITAIKKI